MPAEPRHWGTGPLVRPAPRRAAEPVEPPALLRFPNPSPSAAIVRLILRCLKRR